MTDCLETERLILHRHIFEDGALDCLFSKKKIKSSPRALAKLIKRNNVVFGGIIGWWIDVSSVYSAGHHLVQDEKAWRLKRHLQYYIYEKESQKCIGIFCALIDKNEAYVLFWLSLEGQHKGYSSEITKETDKELFLTLGIKKVKYECFSFNPYFSKVSSFLKANGYTVVKNDTKSTVWEKTNNRYYEENQIMPAPFIEQKKNNLLFQKVQDIFSLFRC